MLTSSFKMYICVLYKPLLTAKPSGYINISLKYLITPEFVLQTYPAPYDIFSRQMLGRRSKLPINELYICSCYNSGAHQIENTLRKVSLISTILSLVIFLVFNYLSIDLLLSKTSIDLIGLKSNTTI